MSANLESELIDFNMRFFWRTNRNYLFIFHSCCRITSLQFIVLHDNATGVFQRGFSPIKVVCASMDGYIQCIDIHGRLFAATQVNTGVRSIHCDGYTIFGGCDDGSVRVWMMEGSSIKEQLRYPGAHIYVNAISFSKSDALLFTGGSEGNLKVWSVKY